MLPQSGRAGAFPTWTLTALVLVTLSILMFQPVVAESVSLDDGLGPEVATDTLDS